MSNTTDIKLVASTDILLKEFQSQDDDVSILYKSKDYMIFYDSLESYIKAYFYRGVENESTVDLNGLNIVDWDSIATATTQNLITTIEYLRE